MFYFYLFFLIRHGNQERVFRLEFISNQEFTEPEFLKWKDTLIQSNIPLPTVDTVETKMKDIKEAMIYEFKEEDIETVTFISQNYFRHK